VAGRFPGAVRHFVCTLVEYRVGPELESLGPMGITVKPFGASAFGENSTQGKLKNMATCGLVVIVEDDQAIRETLQQAIELEGYKVRTAGNGEEALALLKELSTPCLILTDLSMPIMDGYQFIELASKTHTIALIPIVVVSASPRDAEVKVVAESGKIKGLIKKPVDLDYLMKIVTEHCGPPAS
jgi:CheY-like chemotaxis protein